MKRFIWPFSFLSFFLIINLREEILLGKGNKEVMIRLQDRESSTKVTLNGE